MHTQKGMHMPVIIVRPEPVIQPPPTYVAWESSTRRVKVQKKKNGQYLIGSELTPNSVVDGANWFRHASRADLIDFANGILDLVQG